MAGYTTKYKGGNAELDAALAKQSAAYNAARKKALAGDESAVTAMREANDAANQLRNQFGYAAEYANGDIESVKKQINYTGSSGAAKKKPATVTGAGTGTGSSAATPSYADLMKQQQEAYDKIQAQQEAAKKAAVKQAVGSLEAQKKDVNQTYADLNRQLYINRRMAEKRLPQQMAAMGYNGGLTESSVLGLQTDYHEGLRQGEQERIRSIADLDKAITDTELQGDISIAELAAQNTKDKLATYAELVAAAKAQENSDRAFAYQQQQAALAQENYLKEFARQEALDQLERDDLDYSRKLAAAQYLYESAGDASGLRMLGFDDSQIAALQKQWAVDKQKKVSGTGSSVNSNPVLTYSQMMEQINAGNVTPNVLSAYEYYLGTPYEQEEVAQNSGLLQSVTGVSFTDLKRTIGQLLATGQAARAAAELEKYEAFLSGNQINELAALVGSYGLGN